MGAAFLCGVCGIENRTVDNSAAYIAFWLRVLAQETRLVIVAAAQAQRAADFIQGVVPAGRDA
jgi:antirestriction protein ArdC